MVIQRLPNFCKTDLYGSPKLEMDVIMSYNKLKQLIERFHATGVDTIFKKLY